MAQVKHADSIIYQNKRNKVIVNWKDGNGDALDLSGFDSVGAVLLRGFNVETVDEEFTVSTASSQSTITLTKAQTSSIFSSGKYRIEWRMYYDSGKADWEVYFVQDVILSNAFEGDTSLTAFDVAVGDSVTTVTVTSGVTVGEVATLLSNATTKTPDDTDIFTGVTSAGALFGSAWSTIKTALASAVQTLTNKTITSPIETVNALGSISGSNEIDVSAGSIVTATLTGTTTFTFSGEPGSGERSFVLKFSGAQTINWPANTIFAGGAAPSITGPDYEIPCSIDSSGVVAVHGIIDEYATL